VIAQLISGGEQVFHEHLIEAESFDEAVMMVDQLYEEQVRNDPDLFLASGPQETAHGPSGPVHEEAHEPVDESAGENASADDDTDSDDYTTDSEESSELSMAKVRTEN